MLRGKAAKEIPVTPRNTAIGAAAAAACPGFGALYTNYKRNRSAINRCLNYASNYVTAGVDEDTDSAYALVDNE